MLGLFRIFNGFMALLLGWMLAIGVILLGLGYAWHEMQGMLIGRYQIPPAPSVNEWTALMVGIPVSITFAVFGAFLVTPGWWLIRTAMPLGTKLVPAHGHWVGEELKRVCKAAKMDVPNLYIAYSLVPNAFAISSMLSNNIIVTTQLIRKMKRHELRWVLAHELGHIRYMDSVVNGFWISVMRVLRFGHWLHYHAMRFFFGFINVLQFPYMLGILLFSPLLFAIGVLRTAEFLVRNFFVMLDRLMVRMMEYRADRHAADLVGPRPGVAVLSKLGSKIEKRNPFFATHPSDESRIMRLLKYEVSQ